MGHMGILEGSRAGRMIDIHELALQLNSYLVLDLCNLKRFRSRQDDGRWKLHSFWCKQIVLPSALSPFFKVDIMEVQLMQINVKKLADYIFLDNSS